MRRLFFLIALLRAVLQAESTPEAAAKKAYLANINALIIFTTQSGLNSGRYEFTRANATMNVIHLGDDYNFDPFEENLNLFLMGGGGYSETVMTTELNGTDPQNTDIALTSTNMLQTFTGGIGGGLRYENALGLALLSGAEVIFSRVGVRNRDGNDVGEIVDGFFTGKYNNNFSYHLFAKAEFRREVLEFKPYVTLAYELYETKSAFSFEELSTFSSQSHVTSFAIGSETPPLIRYEQMYLSLEGYLRGSYLGGDLARVANFDGYGTVGGAAYLYTEEVLEYFRKFYLELSTIQADGLRGYNLGLGFSVKF